MKCTVVLQLLNFLARHLCSQSGCQVRSSYWMQWRDARSSSWYRLLRQIENTQRRHSFFLSRHGHRLRFATSLPPCPAPAHCGSTTAALGGSGGRLYLNLGHLVLRYLLATRKIVAECRLSALWRRQGGLCGMASKIVDTEASSQHLSPAFRPLRRMLPRISSRLRTHFSLCLDLALGLSCAATGGLGPTKLCLETLQGSLEIRHFDCVVLLETLQATQILQTLVVLLAHTTGVGRVNRFRWCDTSIQVDGGCFHCWWSHCLQHNGRLLRFFSLDSSLFRLSMSMAQGTAASTGTALSRWIWNSCWNRRLLGSQLTAGAP